MAFASWEHHWLAGWSLERVTLHPKPLVVTVRFGRPTVTGGTQFVPEPGGVPLPFPAPEPKTVYPRGLFVPVLFGLVVITARESSDDEALLVALI